MNSSMSKRINDLERRRFGRLTVLSFHHVDPNRKAVWLCNCDCGNNVLVVGQRLISGATKSCGCLRKEQTAKNATNCKKHGQSGTRLYNIWKSMITRCYNKNHVTFINYGGRGINVCSEWKDVTNFIDWALGNGYDETLTIDRINNNGNYEPSNCRWATMKEQSNNRRTNRIIKANGERKTVAEWSDEKGLNYSTLEARILKQVVSGDKLFDQPSKGGIANG